jgi:hypothetical protein
MEIEDNEFLDLIVAWINGNAAKIRRIHKFEKGWEGWAQCEIADFISTREPHSVVRREDTPYSGKTWRTDLYYWCSDFNKQHIIEIKCKSHNKTDGDFLADANADANKIIDRLEGKYAAATKWCLTFVWRDTVMSNDWHDATGVIDLNGPLLKFRRFPGYSN